MSMIFNFLSVTQVELDSYLTDSSLLEDRIYEDQSEDSNLIDIDQAWDGIMFLLTGASYDQANHELAKVLRYSQIIDEDQDLGYGPAGYVTPEQVVAIYDAIKSITPQNLANNYNATKMTALGIHPNGWQSEENIAYLTSYFEDIQNIYAEAVKNNHALITFIN